MAEITSTLRLNLTYRTPKQNMIFKKMLNFNLSWTKYILVWSETSYEFENIHVIHIEPELAEINSTLTPNLTLTLTLALHVTGTEINTQTGLSVKGERSLALAPAHAWSAGGERCINRLNIFYWIKVVMVFIIYFLNILNVQPLTSPWYL